MFRTCESYDFELCDNFDLYEMSENGETRMPCRSDTNRIPCRIEITSRRDVPDVDPCNPNIDDTTDGRLSMATRSMIIDRIAEHLHGKPIDGPILGSGVTGHAPERIAVWAYWFARDQSRLERERGGWRLTVESARVVVGDRWSVEYAPASGDR